MNHRITLFLLFLFSFFLCNSASAQSIGILYGLTYAGGANGTGAIISFDPLSGQERVVYSFPAVADDSTGLNPYGNLIQAKNGYLYGMCAYGGVNGSTSNGGVIYHYDLVNNKISIDWSFPDTINDGDTPYNSLLQARDSILYGMTYVGGGPGSGSLIGYNTNTATETTRIDMRGVTTGDYPTSNFVQDTNGLLYGMGIMGGTSGLGTIFSLDPVTGTTALLYSFGGPDGNYPRGGAIVASDGQLYGVTVNGGTAGKGNLYSYNITTGVETSLVNFGGLQGESPEESVMQASDGYIYGLASRGGTGTQTGVLYRYDMVLNTETVLFNFDVQSKGQVPFGDLIETSLRNKVLYGMTYVGGTQNVGVIFSYNLNTNTETVLHNFNDTTGAEPNGDLLEAMSVSTVVHNNACTNDSAGSIKVNVRGAIPPVIYTWSNGATTDSISNLKSGPYTCTISDSRGITFTIHDTVKPLPMALTFQYNNPCSGSGIDSTIVSVSGGTAPFTYSWSNGQRGDTLHNVPAGTYTCYIVDSNGCTASSRAYVQGSTPISIVSVNIVTTWCSYCLNGSITVNVTGGIPPGDSSYYFYLWSNGGSDSATLANIGVDTFAVCITSPYGCGSLCDSNLIIAVGVPTISDLENQVHIYPNPSTGAFSLSLAGNGFEKIEITDILGRIAYTQNLSTEAFDYSLNFNISNEPEGVYLLHIISTKGTVTKKIVLQK